MGFTIGTDTPSPVEPTGAPPPITPWLSLYDTAPFRLQLLGITGAGKTTLIGELAKYLFQERRQRTLLYLIDRGSPASIQALIDANIIIQIPRGDRDPFVFADRAAHGQLPRQGKWAEIPKELDIGLVAFDSATGIGEEQLETMRESVTTNNPIGQKGYSFVIEDESYEDSVKVGTLDGTHYGISQARITSAMWESQALPYNVIWTANLRGNSSEAIRPNQTPKKLTALGADLGGRALIEISPRWFQYTWTLRKVSVHGQAARRILHLDSYLDPDQQVPVVGNCRLPLEGADIAPVPASIEPASLVQAFSVIGRRQRAAKEAIAALGVTQDDLDLRKRLGL